MTVLNEERQIRTFLDSLSGQSTLPSHVIIVDGGSTDDTCRIIRSWKPPTGVTLDLLVEEGASISRGRNVGIAQVTTEWVAVTDAGTKLAPTWLEQLVYRMAPAVDVVGGFFYPLRGPFLQTLIFAVITPTAEEIRAEDFLPSSRSVAFRKLAWSTVGGYPEWLDYCEDLVFDLSLKAEGLNFSWAPRALAGWDARPNLRAFARQYYRYARGDGKARLWTRRHLARYGAYSLGLALVLLGIATRSSLPIVIAGFGATVYLSKFLRRAWGRRPYGFWPALTQMAMTPLVVATGDVAKMSGYPTGLVWRLRKRSNTVSYRP